jgi:hypothetical protein
MSKEAISKAPSGRPVRQPVGLRNRMKITQGNPNKVQRWVVDYDGTGDRIAAFKEGGYTHVESSKNSLKDSRVDNTSPEGSFEQRSVGGGQKAYLMEIDRDLYEQDQVAKQAHVRKTEEALKRPPVEGSYGTISIENENR